MKAKNNRIVVILTLGLFSLSVLPSCTKYQNPETCEHVYKHEEELEPTYAKDGYESHYYCKKCNSYFNESYIRVAFEDLKTRLPIFDYVDSKNPVSVFGRNIDITYDESKKAQYKAKCLEIEGDVQTGTLPYEQVKTKLGEVYSFYYYFWDEYVKSNIHADATGKSEYYDLVSEINELIQDYTVFDVGIEKDIASSPYRNAYYEGWSEEQINSYVASLNKEAKEEEAYYKSQIEKVKNDYFSGVTTDRHQAVEDYVSAANSLARVKNYSNFMDYAYVNDFNREYSVADTDNLKSVVKDTIVPMYISYASILSMDVSAEDAKAVNSLDNDFFGSNLKYIDSYTKYISEGFHDNLAYYFNSGNYFYSSYNNPNATAYVWEFTNGTPLMFMSGGYQNTSTFIHEFGHYNARLMRSNITMDLNEVHSQGNELMFCNYLKKTNIASGNAIDLYTKSKLSSMCFTIIMGYAINEIEKYIFTENFNEESLINKWARIGQSIGLNFTSAGIIDYMYQVILNYNAYYISYAVSAIAALELYGLSLLDEDAAKKAYVSLYTPEQGEDTFSKALENAGLYNVFSDEAYELIGVVPR